VGNKASGICREGCANADRSVVFNGGRGGAVAVDDELVAPLPELMLDTFGVPLARLEGVEFALFAGAMLAGDGSICGFFAVSDEGPDPASPSDSSTVIAVAISSLHCFSIMSSLGSTS
jgi:hypothetical protein